MGDMTREPSMEDILSSIRRVIARDEAPEAGSRDPDSSDPAAAGDDILDLNDEETAPAASETAPGDDLVSARSADAARQSLEALNAVITPAPQTAAGVSDTRSMEAVVMEALRPMLKQWLDANLPEIVEAMVAREISRITGRRL